MEEIDIIKGNKLIAESIDREASEMFYFPQIGHSSFDYLSLKFHSSYAWQLAVVEWIEKKKFLVNIIGNGCYIYDLNQSDHPQIVTVDADTKLEAIYEALVEFFKWYNQQPK